MKEYFLTEMKLQLPNFNKPIIVKQLVKSTNKKNARGIVKDKALEEGYTEENILEIIVFDTLIGD